MTRAPAERNYDLEVFTVRKILILRLHKPRPTRNRSTSEYSGTVDRCAVENIILDCYDGTKVGNVKIEHRIFTFCVHLHAFLDDPRKGKGVFYSVDSLT